MNIKLHSDQRGVAHQLSATTRLPLASYHDLPHVPCPHGCRHPQTKERVKVRYGNHLVTDCRKANQGKKSHKDVEAVGSQITTSVTR
jgi:hypothetical protein